MEMWQPDSHPIQYSSGPSYEDDSILGPQILVQLLRPLVLKKLPPPSGSFFTLLKRIQAQANHPTPQPNGPEQNATLNL